MGNQIFLFLWCLSSLIKFYFSSEYKTYISFDGCKPKENCSFSNEQLIKYASQGLALDAFNINDGILHKTYLKCIYSFFTCGYVPYISNDASRFKGKGVPSNDYGVNIGAGFNLKNMNETFLTNVGLSTNLIEKFKPYFGEKGKKASDILIKNQLTITDDEAEDLLEKTLNYCYKLVLKDVGSNVTDSNMLRTLTYFYYDSLNMGLNFKVNYKKVYDAFINKDPNLFLNEAYVKRPKYALTENYYKLFLDLLIVRSTISDDYFDKNLNAIFLVENSNTLSQASLKLAKSFILNFFEELTYLRYSKKTFGLSSYNNDTSIKINLTTGSQVNITNYVSKKLDEITTDYKEYRPVNISQAIINSVDQYKAFLGNNITYSIPNLIVIFSEGKISSNEERKMILNAAKYAYNNKIKLVSIGYNFESNITNLKDINGGQLGRIQILKNIDTTELYNSIYSSMFMSHFLPDLNTEYYNSFSKLELDDIDYSSPHFYEIIKSRSKNIKVNINVKKGAKNDLIATMNGQNPYPILDYQNRVFPPVITNKTAFYHLICNRSGFFHNYIDEDYERVYIFIKGTDHEYSISFEECDPNICYYRGTIFTGFILVILVVIGIVIVYLCYVLFYRLYKKYKVKKLAKHKQKQKENHNHSAASENEIDERLQNDLTTGFT